MMTGDMIEKEHGSGKTVLLSLPEALQQTLLVTHLINICSPFLLGHSVPVYSEWNMPT